LLKLNLTTSKASNLMKLLLYKLGCYLAKRFCPHKNKIHIMYNYYERCEVEQCIECKEKIYTEI
jgi:hypothetical protein